jgi:hypothetical protein
MGHLEDVPQALRADWARANVSVFEEIERAQEAQDEVALERGLKWYLVLHDVLLRGLQRGTRGSGRSANALAIARHRIRRVPYIGVPRAVVERRMQRGQLIGGPQARVPLYVPYTPTSSSTRPARDGWPAARKRASGFHSHWNWLLAPNG